MSTLDTVHEIIRTRIQLERAAQKKSQEALCEDAKLPYGTIQRIESGYKKGNYRRIKVIELIKISEDLNVDTSYLCGQTDHSIYNIHKSIGNENDIVIAVIDSITSLRNGMPLKKLSQELGFEKGLIGKIEKAERPLYIDELVKIADYFHVSVAYLCGQTNHKSIEALTNEYIIKKLKADIDDLDKNSLRELSIYINAKLL